MLTYKAKVIYRAKFNDYFESFEHIIKIVLKSAYSGNNKHISGCDTI